MGQEMIVTADLYRAFGERIENPTYTVWFYPLPPEGMVVDLGVSGGAAIIFQATKEQAGGDEIIEVYDSVGLWTYLEVIGTNELWTAV